MKWNDDPEEKEKREEGSFVSASLYIVERFFIFYWLFIFWRLFCKVFNL